jgi:2'-phosphotransferase
MSTDGYIPLDAVLQSSKKLQRYTVDDVRDVVESNDKQRFTLCMKNIMKMKNSDDGDKIVQDFKKYTFVTESNDDNNEGRTMKEEVVLCIRANQGHSITGLVFDELLTPIPPEELEKLDIIVHGTYKAAWENGIRDKGLNRMKRNHIHFARGFPEGKRPTTTSGTEKEKSNVVISGMRNSCELYIYVDGKKCARDGVKFYRSSNEVILTSGITEDGTLPVTYFSKVIDAKSGENILK